ncbi:MAG: HAD family hydrolase [Candidatus Woesearchaeota archaeon]|nr:MAG: HAD family hydrolase [Candidatus Woesearchaeota archaeon]
MKQKKIICFDMDGTLINSFPAHAKAFNKAFKANKLPEQSEPEMMKLFGVEAKIIIKKFFPKISVRKLEVCIEDFHNFLREETYVHTKQIDGAMEALKKLKKEWKLALVSGTFKSEVQLLLREGGIDQRIFDIVIGGDEVKHEKPSPELIKKAGDILESEIAWMVGDTIWDIKAGKAAKVRTVAVLTGKTPIEELVKVDPTMIIQSVYMLPEALKA